MVNRKIKLITIITNNYLNQLFIIDICIISKRKQFKHIFDFIINYFVKILISVELYEF